MRLLVSAVLVAALALAACDSAEEDVAQANSIVTVAYVGTLPNGSVFDRSPGATFSLGGVIPGFRTGVVGMRVGETRTFDVSPEQGYGANPPSGIPPNTTLTFEVTLLGIR